MTTSPPRALRTAASGPLALALALLATAVPARAQEPGGAAPSGTISGAVTGRFQDQLRPLPFATVQGWTVGLRRSVVADSLGRYRLSGLPAGLIRLRVTHAGHAPSVLDVMVPAGGAALVDVELRGRPVELPAVDVTSTLRISDPEGRDADAALAEVEVAALGSGAGLSQAGVADAVRALPGNDPAQATDVLFMRGSTTDLKLVLLDGAPVFTPFHVAGLLQSFEPAALGRAELHMGGAPARYDGGLTYILDLRTRRPRGERIRGSGSADLLSAGVTLDGPLGGSSGFVASTRALHDLASDPLGSSPYGYRDALLSVETEPAPGQLLRATGFWNRESVLLELPGRVGAGLADAWWSNRAASASWEGRAGGLLTEVTVAGGAYEASLPLQPSAPAGEPLPDPLLATASNQRLRATAEVVRPGDEGVVRVGVTAETTDTEYEAGPFGGAPESRTVAEARTGGVYVDVTRRVSEDLTVRGGLRADGFSGAGGGLLFAPRASLTWTLAPRAFLTVTAGRYHQHARPPQVEVERAVAAAGDGTLPPTELLPVATADHVVLSLDQELGERTRLGLEGFWKGYGGLGEEGERIRSSGVDLRVRRTGEDFALWVGYGLSWFWSTTDLSGSPDDFSGRHLLTAGMDGRLAGPLGGGVRLAYGAGLPYTSIPFGSEDDGLTAEPGQEGPTPGEVVNSEATLAGGVDDAFLRLDVELNALITPRWGGREWRILPYLRLLNALDRRDALFYAFSRSEGAAPLAERSLIPVVGFRWRF